MKPLQLSRPAMIMTPSDTISSVALTTSPQTIDIPAGAQFVSFAAQADFFAQYGAAGAAAVPTTTTTTPSTALTASELNPTIRDLHSTQKTTGISVVAPVAGGMLTLGWYGPGG